MKQHYPDLRALLEEDQDARRYYDGLPDHVKEMMSDREQGINSFESLCHYAEKLCRGDS